MAISDKQLEANINNAKLGGVKTTDGKEISKLNSLKHGIFKLDISDYEKSQNIQIQEFVYEEYQPNGFEEILLADRIAAYLIRVIRINKAEREFMAQVLDPAEEMDFSWGHAGYKPVMNSEHVKLMNDTYLRYQITNENRLDRSISQLKELKKARNA